MDIGKLKLGWVVLRLAKAIHAAAHAWVAPQLRRLAAGELWADLCRALSDAIHPEIPPDHGR